MLLTGQRGAPHVAPANTLASFRSPCEAGCDRVECDCRVSADGIVVLAHDAGVVDREGRRHALADMGVDGIISNRPYLLARLR